MSQNDPPPIPERAKTPPPVPETQSPPPQVTGISEGKAVYNAVSDTVIGVNVRKSDNKFQAFFILWSILISSVLGGILVPLVPGWSAPWYGGVFAGAIIGLLAGFFASGIYLMIYRGARHLQGKHD